MTEAHTQCVRVCGVCVSVLLIFLLSGFVFYRLKCSPLFFFSPLFFWQQSEKGKEISSSKLLEDISFLDCCRMTEKLFVFTTRYSFYLLWNKEMIFLRRRTQGYSSTHWYFYRRQQQCQTTTQQLGGMWRMMVTVISHWDRWKDYKTTRNHHVSVVWKQPVKALFKYFTKAKWYSLVNANAKTTGKRIV